MNSQQQPLTLPTKPTVRTHNLNVRLSAEEKADLAALAQQQGVTCSLLARHFLAQAIAYYKLRAKESGIASEK